MLLSELDVKNGRCVTKDSEGDHWVTIKKDPDGHGRKILLDKNGKIIGGDVPKHFQGKHIGKYGSSEEFKKQKTSKETSKKEESVVKKQKIRAHVGSEVFNAGPHGEAEFIAKELGVDFEKAKNMREAVSSWSGNKFIKMRKAMAFPDKYRSDDKEQVLKLVSSFEEYIEKAPKWDGNGELFRGIRFKQEEIGNIKVGNTVDMRGVSSWSSSKSVAIGFAEENEDEDEEEEIVNIPVILKMEKSDTGTSIKHLSGIPGEEEIVCPKSTRYKIVDVKRVGTRFYVSVKEEV